MKFRLFAALSAVAFLPFIAPTIATAQSEGVKIGVINDMSSVFSDVGGAGSVVAAKMAVEDFGGSVLGQPIEVIWGDHQNKPDVGRSIVGRWFDVEGVDVVSDIINSGVAVSIHNLAREKNKIVLLSGLNNKDISGRDCSNNSMVWGYDSYSIGKSVSQLLKEDGYKSWFFLTVDYASGHNMETDATSIIEQAGGSVAGAIRYPLGTTDYASFLLQAQSSNADAIALATGGVDMQNIIKQAAEFGVKQNIVGLIMTSVDINALGLQVAQGIPLSTPFYWDINDKTREWSNRFKERHGQFPTDMQAMVYSSTLHYLKAVQNVGSKETDKVIAAMKETPVNDFMTDNAVLRKDGRLLRDVYLARVKSPDESTSADDVFEIISKVPGDSAYRPVEEVGCPLLDSSQ